MLRAPVKVKRCMKQKQHLWLFYDPGNVKRLENGKVTGGMEMKKLDALF